VSKYLKALRDRRTWKDTDGADPEVMGQKEGRKFMQTRIFSGSERWFFVSVCFFFLLPPQKPLPKTQCV